MSTPYDAPKTRGLTLTRTLTPALCAIVSTLALLASPQAGAAQAAAGTIIYSQGSATLNHDGKNEQANKGQPVETGDTVVTGQGAAAQIKFSDGAYVAVGPQSEFAIEKYVDAHSAQNDSFIMRLARGSMRAITGLIGKREHKNYLVKTATATLGIRGSSYLLAYQDNGTITATTEQDGIVLCTQAGCVDLAAGETGWVYASDKPPEIVSSQASIPMPDIRRDATLPNEIIGASGFAFPALSIPAPAIYCFPSGVNGPVITIPGNSSAQAPYIFPSENMMNSAFCSFYPF